MHIQCEHSLISEASSETLPQDTQVHLTKLRNFLNALRCTATLNVKHTEVSRVEESKGGRSIGWVEQLQALQLDGSCAGERYPGRTTGGSASQPASTGFLCFRHKVIVLG